MTGSGAFRRRPSKEKRPRDSLIFDGGRGRDFLLLETRISERGRDREREIVLIDK